MERRIASLSGSDNAADIAERRRLEKDLYEAREGLNDTYYDHAKDAQQQALDDEATAYEESMNKFIEGLRDSLETATEDMNLFMQGVISAVTSNAPAIVEEYGKLDVALNDAIINPWTEAANAITAFGGADGLGIMNSWIAEGGVFPTFKADATTSLTTPWQEGGKALTTFEGSVTTSMGNMVKTIRTNVAEGVKELQKLDAEQAKINDSAVISTGDKDIPVGDYGNGKGGYNENVAALQQILNGVWNAGLEVDGKLGTATTTAIKNAQMAINKHYKSTMVKPDGAYGPETRAAMLQFFDDAIRTIGNNAPSSYIGQGIKRYQEYKKKLPVSLYAKGTMGTSKSGFAITDESWLGEEITLAAGKNGQLQYLRKGSAVMPADISANLVEWGKLNPDMMNVGVAPNLNMISNAVNKPEFNMSFDSLVHVDHCDEGTLRDLEKMVDTKINQFSKQMNYAIKKIGGR